MKATPTRQTVAQYLAGLPADRRAVVRAARTAVRRALPKGYKEVTAFGGIAWVVPFSVLPDTYNGLPLCYVALAAQKNYYALHLMGPYGFPPLRKALESGYKKAGKRLDMGKACLRFRSMDDLALDVIAHVIGQLPMDRYVAAYRALTRR